MPTMRVTQAERQRTQEALIRSGLELFAGQGFARTTVDQIAMAAGVAKGTFYNYFASKEDLALAALVTALGDIRDRMADLVALPSFPERLEVLLAELGRWTGGQPELVGLWTIENLRRGRAEPASARFGDILAELCADAQRRGEVRADVPADELALQLEGVVLAHIARWYHAGSGAGLHEALARGVALYMEGARRDPRRTGGG